MSDTIYYVYAYINKTTGKPYYIGKGKGTRAFNKHVGISVPADKSKIIFLKESLSEQEAWDYEKKLIAMYGRKNIDKNGILLNVSEGGSGGFNVRAENYKNWKNKISNTLKVTNSKNDYWKKGIERANKAVKGVPQSENHKRKRAISQHKEIEIEGITYDSAKEAANKLGYCTSAISSWAKKNGSRYGIKIKKNYSLCGKKNSSSKAVIINNVEYECISDAMKATNLSRYKVLKYGKLKA